MNILVVNQYFPPDAAASANMLGELAEDLARRHSVDVVAGRPSYTPEAGAYVPDGVRVTRAPSTTFDRRGLAGRAANYLTFLASAAFMASARRRPDVVVTMTDPPVVGLLGALAARLHRCPFVLLCHDVYPDVALALGVLKPGLGARVWRRLNGFIRRSASQIVVVGRDMAEKLAAEGTDPSRITYVPTWSLDFGIGAGEREAERARAGWSERFVVMHAGNQGLAQNVSILAEAAGLLTGDPAITVVLLGDGAGLVGVKEEVGRKGLDNVVFLPQAPRAEAQRLMAAADVHVVSLVPGLWGCAAPSKTYGIMAAGRPFVAAVDAGSEPHRIAEEWGCGLRVPAGDAGALAEAIRSLRTSSLEDLGRRAREGFEHSFRRQTATDSIERVLARVAQPRRGSP